MIYLMIPPIENYASFQKFKNRSFFIEIWSLHTFMYGHDFGLIIEKMSKGSGKVKITFPSWGIHLVNAVESIHLILKIS